MTVTLIADDQQIPVEVMDRAARMAKASSSAQEIADRTGLSKERVVRLLVGGALTYSAKGPRVPARKWRRR